MIAPHRSTLRARLEAENERDADRTRQALCRLDFRINDDHHLTCICTPPCSRDYDPMPYPEAEPMGDMYEGTSIAALYGGPMTARMAFDLRGWNIKPWSEYE